MTSEEREARVGNDPRNDPYSGYRPDLDKYSNDLFETSDYGRGPINVPILMVLISLVILGAFMIVTIFHIASSLFDLVF